MLSVNPSQKELRHLAELASGKKIQNIRELTKPELEKYNALFRNYVIQVMDEYAKAFNRGIKSDNLHYFAKIEQIREYKGYEKEVKTKNAKVGEKKLGLQTHAHIIVSRMDKEQKMSLSPRSRSRGHSKNHKLNGKSVQVGFDNVSFKVNSEERFDKMFHYSRELKEKSAYDILYNNAFKVLGIKHNINMTKNAINENALEFFTKHLGEKAVQTVMNSNPYLKVAYKAIKSAKRVLDMGINI